MKGFGNILDRFRDDDDDKEKGGGVIGWVFEHTELDEALARIAKNWVEENREKLIDRAELVLIAALDWLHGELEDKFPKLEETEVDETFLLLVKERILSLSNVIDKRLNKDAD